MLNSRVFDYRIWVTLILSLAFGLGFLVSVPIFEKKQLLLFVFPLIEAFFLIIFVKPKEMLAGLLIVRPVLDLLLEQTKVNVGGAAFGAGAGLNLIVILLTILFKFHYQGAFKFNSIVKAWFLYLFFMFVAAFHTPYIGTAIRFLIDNSTYFTMFMIPLLIVRTQEDFQYWLKVIALSFILPVIVGNIDLLVWHGRYFPDSGQRIAGSFGHPNILAFFMAFGLTLYFYILKSKSFKFKGLSLFFMVAMMLNMLILLFATKTRNAWVACFTGFFIYGLLRDRKFLLLLLLITPLSMLIPSVHQRVVNVFDSSTALDVRFQGRNSYQWRLEMWKSCIPKILENPLQGYGLTSFRPMSAEFSPVGENGAHNVYLEMFFETGIFGVLSFVLIFVGILRIFWKRITQIFNPQSSRLAAIALGYVLSYMMICSADNLMYYLVFNWYVWFFLGLLIKQIELEKIEITD